MQICDSIPLKKAEMLHHELNKEGVEEGETSDNVTNSAVAEAITKVKHQQGTLRRYHRRTVQKYLPKVLSSGKVITYPRNTKGNDKRMDEDKEEEKNVDAESDRNKKDSNAKKEIVVEDSNEAKDRDDIVNKEAEIDVADESVNNKVIEEEEGDNNKMVEIECGIDKELRDDIVKDLESDLQSHGQLIVSVNDKGVSSYPPSMEQITQVDDVLREDNEEVLVVDKAIE
ncbi:hypothetical protein K7X08_013026 [Anisodus acutangulus]|uniref:Uncharacterized protein n=1 Tax=Anisodus acutangulus TaxID=402998 RepID=A0A9Q1RGH6_9SOLA|nr:hypothetical protein K7X08_013026 [Anisodus acutangulus]